MQYRGHLPERDVSAEGQLQESGRSLLARSGMDANNTEQDLLQYWRRYILE